MRSVKIILLSIGFGVVAFCQAPGVIYPQSFGAVCDGTTDDTTAFQSAVNAANPGDTIVIYSSTNAGCVITSGFNISKPISLSADHMQSPTKLLAGANNISIVVT